MGDRLLVNLFQTDSVQYWEEQIHICVVKNDGRDTSKRWVKGRQTLFNCMARLPSLSDYFGFNTKSSYITLSPQLQILFSLLGTGLSSLLVFICILLRTG